MLYSVPHEQVSSWQWHKATWGEDIRNNCFTMTAVKHWYRLCREVVDAPCLWVFRRHLYNTLKNMLWLSISTEAHRQLDKVVFEGPFQLNSSSILLKYYLLPGKADLDVVLMWWHLSALFHFSNEQGTLKNSKTSKHAHTCSHVWLWDLEDYNQ